MANVFDYIFKIGGNFLAQISGMSAATGNFTASVEGADSGVRKFTGSLATFSYLKDVFQNVADGFEQLSGAGIKLDSQMHDLSAVAGVMGEGLKQIEGFARESAKAFGTDAAVAVEGYKLLLSQLSPELGKYPEALSAMGDCIQTTSKLMGGDGVAAAQVLTTAMNQYGVSLEDPTAASEEMARMMNVMAAAGQAGSAELPAISAALTQCGMAAKAANVSFEETNAAIQVLDKAGKKASEGGVALRNVLGQLSKGRFVEKQAREELEAIKEIPKVFTAITNQYNYTDLSERTENTIYNINKTFKDAVTNITNYTTRNICFDTFSYGDILTVKPEYRTVNFAGHVFNTSKIENVTNIEELNSLALPSYSTILNYIYPNYNWLNNTNYINNGIENSYKSVVEKIDLQTGGRFNNETLEIKNENRKNSSSESAAELFVSEPLREEKREFERDDIEDIVMDMLRREVELCLR